RSMCVEVGQLEQNRRGDVVGKVAGNTNAAGARGSGLGASRLEEITFDDGDVRDRGGPQPGGEGAGDFVGDDGVGARGERAGEGGGGGGGGAGAGPNREDGLVGRGCEGADPLVAPRGLEEVRAEALARADHSASPRQ